MKFTIRKVGYVPTVEPLEETLAMGSITKERIKELADCTLSKTQARFEAKEAMACSILSKEARGDGSIVKRQVSITVEIKDVKPKVKK